MILVTSLKGCAQNIQVISHFGYFDFWETLWEAWFSESAYCAVFENQATEEFLGFYMGTHCKVQARTGTVHPDTEWSPIVKFVRDNAITHLFWKCQGICSYYSQEKLIYGRMKWVFLTHVSSVEQLIKSESSSPYLRRYKENENNCTVSASHSPRFGPGY